MADLELVGRITTASNATFLARLDDDASTEVVYKPVRGEQPLWDFPDHTLAAREVAAWVLSDALGWSIVPRTWSGTGPFGPGMLQLWQDVDPAQNPVDIVPAGDIPDGWHRILDGLDPEDNPVSVIHEDSPELRRMAVFDILANNADRKGAHILAMPDGHRFGVDHGLTFHTAPRLRTVLWGWVGTPLTDSEQDAVAGVRTALDADLGVRLGELLSADEVGALTRRCEALLAEPVFPGPSGDMPAVPWPVF